MILFRHASNWIFRGVGVPPLTCLPERAAAMIGAHLPDWAWWAPTAHATVRNLFAEPPATPADRVPAALRHAHALHHGHRLDDAIRAYTTVIAALGRDDGPDAPMTLGARAGLAAALLDAGDLVEAAGEALGVLERAERELPSGHAIILAVRRVNARAMHGCGLLDPAESDLRDLMKAADGQFGPAHRLTLRTRGDLAALRTDRDLAPCDVAEEYTALIEAATDALGPTDEDVLGLRLDDSVRAIRHGRVNAAIPAIERLLATQAAALGAAHPQTIRARHHLAGALLLVGRPAEAELECREAIRHAERLYGPADPRTLAARDRLVRCLCVRKAYRWAERECRATLAGWRVGYGPEHPVTLAARLRLAAILRALGRGIEVADHLGAVRRITRRGLVQPDDPALNGVRMPMELRRGWTPDYAHLLNNVRGIAATRPEPNDF
jgi:hypothetical protein